MGIKPFAEMLNVSLEGKISQKPSRKKNKKTGEWEPGPPIDYLNWADALALLYENGAACVKFGNVRAGADHPVFLLDGTLPFVRIYVDVDGDRRELDYPVIDGSKDIEISKMQQSDVHNATQRAFVKCVAVNWGLGLGLWSKEEKKTEGDKDKMDLEEMSSIFAIQDRIMRLLTEKLKKTGMTEEELCKALGLTMKQYKNLLLYFGNIDYFEKELRKL